MSQMGKLVCPASSRSDAAPPARCRFACSGFTLVELLVVIGIIALLIGFLLPSLGVARQAAQRTACAAKIHTILLAAQLHMMDHHGYYPLAGVIPGYQPDDLDDRYLTKYDYLSDPTSYYTRWPAPITFSLALEMSQRGVLNNSDNTHLGTEETDSQGLIKNFLCPSQASSVSELIQNPLLYVATPASNGAAIAYNEAQSYNFNEAICGWQDVDTTGRFQGRASCVHQASSTMFVADGLMGYPSDVRVPLDGYASGGMATFYNIASIGPVTMADALGGNGSGIGLAGDNANFDLIRHRGKINIGFCDGHVETRNITSADLKSVFLLAP